jgi:very-short-patch-repair endonuclease
MGLKPDTPRGVKALKEYLHFAQHGALPAVGGNTGDHDSPFEKDVAEALRARGWVVDSQIGTAGFSIDLAVVDPRKAGRYLLGIECDGATYHNAATARDRDRLRQAVLERLGWTLQRIWSTDWFEKRESTLKALLERLDELIKKQEEVGPPKKAETPKVDAKPASDLPASAAKPTDMPAAENSEAEKPAAKSQAATKPAENSAADAPVLLRGVTPYTRYSARSKGSREKLLTDGFHKVTDLIVDVVAIEGPIHVDEAMRVVAGLYSARVSGKAKDLLVDSLELAVRSGRVMRRGDFLWHGNGQELAVRWRGEDDAVTAADLIPPEEVAAAAVLVAEQSFGVPADDLAAAALRAMGFKRITQPLAELGRAGVELAVRDKRLKADASGFMIATQPGSNHGGSA